MHLDAWLSILIENESELNWTCSDSPSHVIALWRARRQGPCYRDARYIEDMSQRISHPLRWKR
jgi:hypothetical protein